MAEPAATTKTTTAGIYCQQCGYDLRASAEAGRCPECGRVFSPGDPRTFRPRPLGEWKRAATRWARRAAILFLALLLVLIPCWCWLYWGWHQEHAALAKLRPKEWSALALGDAAGLSIVSSSSGPGFVLLRVESLYLPDTATDADLVPLEELRQLRRLNLLETRITDAGLVHLRGLQRLQWLVLARTKVTDAGLVPLEKLPALELLNLQGTLVTNAGLASLEKLTRLHWLSLETTLVNDAGLVHLEKLTALRRLNLHDTNVTPAGVARLKAALPGCEIVGP